MSAQKTTPIATLALCLFCVFTLALSGRLGRSPETRLFTLGSAGHAAEVRSASSELAILIGPAHFPRCLERPQIVRRLAGGELMLDEFNRWADGFEANVLQALALEVARRVGSDRVVAHPSEPPFALDYRVRLHFDELVAGPDDVLRMRARWAIRPRDGRGEIVLGRTDVDQPVRGGTPTELAEAHGRAIASLAAAVVQAIEGLKAAGETGNEATNPSP